MKVKLLLKTLIFLSVCLFTSSAVFADPEELILTDDVTPNACTFANTGVYSGDFVMVPVYEDIIYTCDPGYYLPKNTEECILCLENSYCAGNENFTFDENVDQGIVSCATGLNAPTGMSDAGSCGRILHVGEDVMYLRSTKKTDMSLNFDMNHDGVADFFGNVTTADVPMNRGTVRKLKIRYNNTTYSIYDDSIDPSTYIIPANNGE